MLLLDKIKFNYTDAKGEVKSSEVEAYFIKGLNGLIRRSAVTMLLEKGIEVCNTTPRVINSKKLALTFEGTHPLGLCLESNQNAFAKEVDLKDYKNIASKCEIMKIFGSIGQQNAASIRLEIPMILGSSLTEAMSKDFPFPYQVRGISRMNNRHNRSMNELIAQDFSQRYIANEITFYINVSNLSKKQIGLMLVACERLRNFGGGLNAGYGQVFPIEIEVVRRSDEYRREDNGNGGKKLIRDLKEEVVEIYDECLQELDDWLNAQGKTSEIEGGE
jgi:hypothetical protein